MSNPPNTTVRLARLGDVPAITAIYNQGIAERNATFETEPRTVEQVIAQLAEKGERYPTLVIVYERAYSCLTAGFSGGE
jgi:L-amino acid N-acyltransferase YncA